MYLTNQLKAKDEIITALNKENEEIKTIALDYKHRLEQNISLEENKNG